MDSIAKCMSMKIQGKFKYHVPKSPFFLESVEMNKEDSDL